MSAKPELRRRMQEALAAAPPARAAAWSRGVCDRLMASELLRSAGTIMAYVPIPGEADVRPVLAWALAMGKRLCLPRMEWGSRALEAVCVESLSDLVGGRYGIPEPPPGTPGVDPGELDAVLVPGLAFDERGARLGRGAGFYDRFLGGQGGVGGGRPGPACGVAFEVQIVQDVPTDPWDVRLDAIATESRWIEVARGR